VVTPWKIPRLVGHRSTSVTEIVYRSQIRPVLQSGAVTLNTAVNGIFRSLLGARR
jgi:hypothetical protein